ncbi:MAG: hypothetical protein AABX70_06480 [Nanoarchaeota archaeon]
MGDLAPPAAPKEEEREGFFSKWLKKVKENPLSPNSKLPVPSAPTEEYESPRDMQPLDLEEIRSKLGIEEEKEDSAHVEIEEQVIEDKKSEMLEMNSERMNDEMNNWMNPERNKEVNPETELSLPSGKENPEVNTEEGKEEKRNQVNERTQVIPDSPWTMDSPDNLLLTDKPKTNLVTGQKEEEINRIKEPPREMQRESEMQKEFTPLQESTPPMRIEVKEQGEEENKESRLSEVENDELIREIAGPQIKEAMPERNRISEITPPLPNPVLANVPNLVNEHFEGVEEGVKALQVEVEKVRIDPKVIQVENTFAKEAAPDKQFILKNGERIASLKDLVEKLDSMSEEVFKEHVTENKNDFANWIKEVLKQEKLSEEIRTKKAKEDLLSILKEEGSEVQTRLDKEKAEVEMEHLDLERKQVELERAKGRFEALKSELENKGKEWEAFKQHLITDIQANLAEGVSKALVSEQQKLEQEKIRVAGLQNKVEIRLKALERDRRMLEEERKGWEAQRVVLESLKERESLMAQKEGLFEEREHRLKDQEAEVKAMQSALKEALSNSNIESTSVKTEEKQPKKKPSKKVKIREEELNVPGEEELRDLEEKILKKMKTSKDEEKSVTFNLRKLDVALTGESKNSRFSSKEEIEERMTHCRKLIEAGHLEAAKEEYNRIKDLFARASLEPEDKSLIYNSIRELYNDIHLALLA